MSTLSDRIAYWIDADEHLRDLVELLQRDEIDERWAGALDEAVRAAWSLIDSSGPRLVKDRPEPRSRKSRRRSGTTVRNHDSGTMTKDRRPAGRAAPSARDPHTTELAVVIADRGMSARQLAAASGVAQSVVYRVLSGKGASTTTQQKIADVLAAEVGDLFEGAESEANGDGAGVTEPGTVVTEPPSPVTPADRNRDDWSDSDRPATAATSEVADPLSRHAPTASRLTEPTGVPVTVVEPRFHGSHSANGHAVRTAP